MSQCAAAQSCVCTVYAAFVHGHYSLINGGWSVDENQEERTSLWLPVRVHVHLMGSAPAGRYLRVQKPPRVTEQHVIRLFVGKQCSEILYMSVHSLSMPRRTYYIYTMTSNVTIKQIMNQLFYLNTQQRSVSNWSDFPILSFWSNVGTYYNSSSFRLSRLIIIYFGFVLKQGILFA